MSVWVCGGCGVHYAVGAPRCPHCATDQPTDGNTVTALPSLTVACTNSQCRHQGVARRVMIPQIVPGVLAVPDLRCAGCGNVTPTVEGGNNMPKISVHGGATNATEDTTSEGSEQPSPGTSSSTSSEKGETSPQPSEPAPSRPVRTTANRSKKARTGASSAAGTGGGRTAATSASDEDEGNGGASDTA